MALNVSQVAAGVMGATLVMGVCSCTNRGTDGDLAPTGGATQAEQTVNPTATDGATEVPAGQFDTKGFKPSQADWPALKDGYVFSDVPQSVEEQWIQEMWPHLWDDGVRAVTPDAGLPDYKTFGATGVFGPTVQYVGGQRFEGTVQMPLAFRNATDPNVFPVDIVHGWLDNTPKTNAGNRYKIDYGQASYTVYITEHPELVDSIKGGDAADTSIKFYDPNHNELGTLQEWFPDWATAWAYLQQNGFHPPKGDRELYPAELMVEVFDSNYQEHAYDSSVGQFVEVIRN